MEIVDTKALTNAPITIVLFSICLSTTVVFLLYHVITIKKISWDPCLCWIIAISCNNNGTYKNFVLPRVENVKYIAKISYGSKHISRDGGYHELMYAVSWNVHWLYTYQHCVMAMSELTSAHSCHYQWTDTCHGRELAHVSMNWHMSWPWADTCQGTDTCHGHELTHTYSWYALTLFQDYTEYLVRHKLYREALASGRKTLPAVAKTGKPMTVNQAVDGVATEGKASTADNSSTNVNESTKEEVSKEIGKYNKVLNLLLSVSSYCYSA